MLVVWCGAILALVSLPPPVSLFQERIQARSFCNTQFTPKENIAFSTPLQQHLYSIQALYIKCGQIRALLLLL